MRGKPDWTDEQSLTLMELREPTDKRKTPATWDSIGRILGKPAGTCESHYKAILRDMRQVGWA